MLTEVASYLLYVYGLMYASLVPCPYPDHQPVDTSDHQQYLGKYFKAAASQKQAHVQDFTQLDSAMFTMEEVAKGTLLLTGHMRRGGECLKQTWTYHVQPDSDGIVLEGRPQRRNLFWSGLWAQCRDCIILQEVEPPLDETGSEDALNRFMLYARRTEVDSEAVATFLKVAACHNLAASVTPRQENVFCG